MKALRTPHRNTWHERIGHPAAAGIALPIVLASLVFLSALIVAFLLSVGTELKSAKTYAEGGRADLLAQSAVNLAMAQISGGTKGYDPDDPARETLAWASQPGMIRTFDTAGDPQKYYRLYSWDTLTGTGGFDPAADESALSQWFEKGAVFSDLNEPLTVAGETTYPIVDERARVGVDGFSVTGAPVEGADTNPIPMPVKWLYVLAGGEIVAPVGGGTTATITGASQQNPIVGRIAFWTDDDTNKININTASEGAYWDTPRTSHPYDGLTLADKQPAQREYQRYPGHPAMTSLSTVFPDLTAEEIYTIIPRVVGGAGSSEGGTKRGSVVLSPDRDRFYTSVDELVFTPVRDQNDPATLTRQTLEEKKFFLTAASRAPDVNLYNKPRVSMWPIHQTDDATRRTPFDQLIAFCATVGDQPFFFQRSNPLSPTDDLPANASDTGLERNRKLLGYLKSFLSNPIPGFGGVFAEKYDAPTGVGGGTDTDQILVQIFDYIRATNLADTSTSGLVPFTPLAPLNKIGSGTGLVTPTTDSATGTRGFGRYPTIKGGTLVFYGVMDDDNPETEPRAVAAPDGQIMIRAFFLPQLFVPAQGYPGLGQKFLIRVTGLNAFQWEGVGANGTSVGFSSMGFPSSATVRMTNNPASTIWPYGEIPLGGSFGDMQAAASKEWKNMTTVDGYPLLTTSAGLPSISGPNPPIADSGSAYVLKGAPFKFKGGDITIEILTPKDSSVSMDTPVTVTPEDFPVVQTVTLRFPPSASEPAMDIPAPEEAPVVRYGGSFPTAVDYRRLVKSSTSPKVRFAAIGDIKESPWIRAEDVVRSVVPAVGDLRLVAARTTIAPDDSEYETLFASHSKYSDSTATHAHILRTSKNAPYYGATGGKLVDLSYHNFAAQYFTSLGGSFIDTDVPLDSGVVPDTFTTGVALGETEMAGSSDLPGDWDNGVSHTPDGPYINKPDEGDASGTTGPYYHWVNNPIGATLFSPNRMTPSAGMLGSLPTGVWANRPWQTLLFRPGPSGHPGLSDPKDHLLLDLFHMPVVEPYAISEPLSTAGRINMNYQIVPFAYIKRDTAIRALLKDEKVIAIADSQASTYKQHQRNNVVGPQIRRDVDVDETLEGFEERFASGDIFRSASEICDIHIVPDGATYESMPTYWNDKRLTGDNSRERPYTTIYPRLTTKSNTFTIFYRAQALKKIKGTPADVWSETSDLVTGEVRGSQTVERYMDPNNALVLDYATAGEDTPISDFYRFRIIEAKRFGQ